MDPKVWDIFHDGTIVSIRGSLPGDLLFVIDLGYIREQFAGDGSTFHLRTLGCDRVSFKSFKNERETHGAKAMQNAGLQILSGSVVADEFVLITVEGVLRLRYLREVVALDTGQVVEYPDLAAAADHAVRMHDTETSED